MSKPHTKKKTKIYNDSKFLIFINLPTTTTATATVKFNKTT